MAAPQFPIHLGPYRCFSLEEIDAIVSARLGATRTRGNAQPACFNRQIAMYLAKTVGGWPTTEIGRFYNGRDHSTVCYGVQRIESLREADQDVDALITSLKGQLTAESSMTIAVEAEQNLASVQPKLIDLERLADLIAVRIYTLMVELTAGRRSQIGDHQK